MALASPAYSFAPCRAAPFTDNKDSFTPLYSDLTELYVDANTQDETITTNTYVPVQNGLIYAIGAVMNASSSVTITIDDITVWAMYAGSAIASGGQEQNTCLIPVKAGSTVKFIANGTGAWVQRHFYHH